MTESKRKSRGGGGGGGGGAKKRSESGSKTLTLLKKNRKGKTRARTGPRLPNQLRKAVEALNPKSSYSSDSDGDGDVASEEANDVYEYEERFAEEESKKNRRFDPVDNFEYELPDDFEDEDVSSDDDYDEEEGQETDNNGTSGERANSDLLLDEDEEEENDDGRRLRMLQNITGLPAEAFDGKKRRNTIVVSESYPESEYNPTRDVLDGKNHISIQDLLDPLHGKKDYSKIRKNLRQVEKKSMPVLAPLPTADKERLERKAAYELSKKEISKWEPLIKTNREAPTIYFNEDVNLGFSTVGAMASRFEPRTNFEKKMASLVHDDIILEAHKNDGTKLLELNKLSVEDVKDRQNQLAKMRSLLFQGEVKAKRLKHIKSKLYHRMLKKDRLKVASTDPKLAEELKMKQEFRRAEERMTLKHKNNSKWAKRILKRGLHAQDEGTRAAISEQLHQHTLLRRKMNSTKDCSSGSNDSSDGSESSTDSDQDGTSKLIAKAKEKTLKVLEEEDEVANSGVCALPFMVRGLKKKKELAYEEAKIALQEYDLSLKQLGDTNGAESAKGSTSGGRRVFNAAKRQVTESSNKTQSNINHNGYDSEDEILENENFDVQQDNNHEPHKDAHIDIDLLREESEAAHDSVFKSFDDIVRDPGPKTTYEVAICASVSQSQEKIGGKTDFEATTIKSSNNEKTLHDQDIEVGGEDSDTDSEGQMMDGMLSSDSKPTYELPSQPELIHRAFATDDVEEDFEKEKLELLNEEIPQPEKHVLLPGWGQWTDKQKKKGLPAWMVKDDEIARRKRDQILKSRRDADLKHVIISERLDKRAEKLLTKTLPHPFTSKEHFEGSQRMPIGPEFNPATAVGPLIRPDVVKTPGMIINPIKYKEPSRSHHERAEQGQTKRRQSKRKNKSSGGGTLKRVKEGKK